MQKKKYKKKGTSLSKYNNEIIGIVLLAVGLLVVLSLYFKHMAGPFGEIMRSLLLGLMGPPAYLIPPLIIFYGLVKIFKKDDSVFKLRILYTFILLLMISSFIHTAFYNSRRYENMSFFKYMAEFYRQGVNSTGGGILGGIVSTPFIAVFQVAGTIIIITAISIIDIILLTNISIANFARNVKSLFVKSCKKSFKVIRGIRTQDEDRAGVNTKQSNDSEAADDALFSLRDKKELNLINGKFDAGVEIEITNNSSVQAAQKENENETAIAGTDDVKIAMNNFRSNKPHPNTGVAKDVEMRSTKADEKIDIGMEDAATFDYKFPPIELLGGDGGLRTDYKSIRATAIDGARRLEETLKSFQVEVKVTKISPGPTVTRYELQPGPGVKVKNIVNLADDIALNLASPGVRIEAPIPGKQAIGIEIANKDIMPVYLREVIESEEFMKHPSKIAFALGKDISGENIIANIATMPHVLIAGATGSGKSVCINSIIISLLYKAKPSEVKLLMVDPKVVELGIYNGIPHLLIPVVTDPKKAAGALNWAVQEMMNRYKMFADRGVRDLKGYNALAAEDEGLEPLPQIVIIIDELADLMMVAPKDVEDAVCRLAQMARAAGMHLVIATQRPSVDVITGLIKANIPSRISFAVSSQVDSRTILDMAGAEKLLGRGDMLYYPIGMQKPIRVQGAFVTDHDVSRVVEFIKSQGETKYDSDIIERLDNEGEPVESDPGDNDELLPKAIELVVEAGQASVSFIQRKLGVGYARAGRIIDQMEERGIVGRQEGSKPRQVLISKMQWQEMQMRSER